MNNFIETQVEKAIKKLDIDILYPLSCVDKQVPIVDLHKAQEQIVKQVTIAVCDELERKYKKEYGDYDYTTKVDSEPIDDLKKQCGGE